MSEKLHFEVDFDISKLEAGIDKMEARIKALQTSFGGSTAPLNEPLKETGKHLDNVSSKAKTTSSTFSELKNFIGFAAIAASAKMLVGEIINVTAEYQKYQAVLTNSLGSETLAKQSLSELTDFAAKTPFALTELTGAYVKLNNYGLKPSMEEMRKYGDLASSVGKGFDQLAEAAADAVTGEFERLKEFGIKSKKEGDKITFTFKEQETVVNNSAEAIKNYITGLGDLEGVSGSMAAVSATLGGQISNLGDNWDSLMKAMGGETDGIFASVIKGLNQVIETATWAVKSTKTIRDEVLQKSISDSGSGIKQEVSVMTKTFVEKGGMNEADAQKKAVELYQKQLEQSIVEAQKKYDEVVEKSKSTGKKFIFGKQYKAEVKAIQEASDALKLLKGEKDLLPALFKEDKKVDEKNKAEVQVEFKSAPGTIARLEEELKKLKAKTGTFTNPEQETKNIAAITDKTKELEIAWKKVREEQNKASGISLTGDNGKNDKLKIQSGLLATKAVSTQLATMKKLTKEEEAQLKIEQQKVISQIEFSDNTDNLVKGLNDASSIFGEFSGSVGVLNEDLGKSLGTVSEMASQAAGFVSNLASGNWVGAITSGVGLILNEFVKSEEEAAKFQEEIHRKTEAINELLADRINLLVDAGFINPLEGIDQSIESTRTKLNDAKDDLDSFFQGFIINGKQAMVSINDMMSTVYGEGWTTDNLNKALEDLDAFEQEYADKTGATIYKYIRLSQLAWIDDESFNTAINKIIDLEGEMKNLQEQYVGFTADDIASSIADGIMDGFKLGADGALGDFGDSFNEILKKAARNAIVTSFNSEYFDKMQEEMTKAMSEDSDGGKTITQAEIDAISGIYAEGVAAMQAGADAWSLVIGDMNAAAEDSNSLSGSISASLTEETGSLLAGKINSMQTHVISISDSVSEMRSIAVSQLESLRTIAGNTSYNWHLKDMAGDISSLKKMQQTTNDALSQIASNTGGSNFDL